jgi:hypothetical protein
VVFISLSRVYNCAFNSGPPAPKASGTALLTHVPPLLVVGPLLLADFEEVGLVPEPPHPRAAMGR